MPAARPGDVGSDQRVAHGLADEDLVGFGECSDARADVHGNAREVAGVVPELTEMEPAAHVIGTFPDGSAWLPGQPDVSAASATVVAHL